MLSRKFITRGDTMTTNQMPTKEELDRDCAFTFVITVRRNGM